MKNKKKPKKINTQNFIFIAVSLVALCGIIVLFSISKEKSTNEMSPQKNAVPQSVFPGSGPEISCNFHRKLDGVCVENQFDINPPVVGIMVENALDAQPLSGVAQASIVYEAAVEGNITRFLAMYPLSAKVAEVGPVRSARPYYIDWLSEYADAMYMHVGGSDEALRNIKKYKLFDINEFYNSKSFWREAERSAPHNTYTSSDLWSTTHEKNIEKFTNDQYSGWKYKEQEACTSNCIHTIFVSFSTGAYDVHWQYDSEKGKYERLQNGVAHKDVSGEAYIADNVIVQHVKMTVVDDVGRKKIITLGEGKVEVFIRGRKVEGMWKKKSRVESTEWFDSAGNEIFLAPGKTWIEVVGPGMTVSSE